MRISQDSSYNNSILEMGLKTCYSRVENPWISSFSEEIFWYYPHLPAINTLFFPQSFHFFNFVHFLLLSLKLGIQLCIIDLGFYSFQQLTNKFLIVFDKFNYLFAKILRNVLRLPIYKESLFRVNFIFLRDILFIINKAINLELFPIFLSVVERELRKLFNFFIMAKNLFDVDVFLFEMILIRLLIIKNLKLIDILALHWIQVRECS